jgi:hypothetical protein
MRLRKFDVFPKLDNEFRIGTTAGGALSLLSLLAIAALSWIEVRSFLHPVVRQRLFVDAARPTELDGVTISSDSQPRVDIFLNITFPHAPCHLLHFDAIDPITQRPLPVYLSRVSLARLSASGAGLGALPPSFLESPPLEECGPCYHSRGLHGECCRSCQDVFAVHARHGYRPPVLSEIPPCAAVYERVRRQEGEGCAVSAAFRAVRMAGEFHVSPGYPWVDSDGWHIHDLRVFGGMFENLNLTHTIHRLEFGKIQGKMPLDGTVFVQNETGHATIIYTADVLMDNYSSAKFALVGQSGRKPPGVNVQYDFSPIGAKIYVDKKPVLHLVTRLLTAVGAVLGVFRFVDMALYARAKKTREDKIEN